MNISRPPPNRRSLYRAAAVRCRRRPGIRGPGQVRFPPPADPGTAPAKHRRRRPSEPAPPASSHQPASAGPLDFAARRGASAWRSSACRVVPSRGERTTPALMAMETPAPAASNGASMLPPSRSNTAGSAACARASGRSSITRTNSSPAMRARNSPGWRRACIRAAQLVRIRSPASCPSRLLMSLNPSRSTKPTARLTGVPGWGSTMREKWASRAPRLGSPVRASWVAWKRSCSCRAIRALMSRWTLTKWVTRPDSSRSGVILRAFQKGDPSLR